MTDLFSPLSFPHGSAMPNRFMLAPLTNQMSHGDGTFSRDEHDWLMMRARGGFGAVMTAAAYVQPEGKGFPGQFAIDTDRFLPELERIAADLKAAGSLSTVQLYHAGVRSPREVTGLELVAPSDDGKSGARAMSTGEVEAMIEAFIVAAERAERAGFDGIELHGAHTYLLCEFLSQEYNRRTDCFGGSLENRARPIREIIAGIRKRCRPQFNLGLRLSAERMGVRMGEMMELAGALMAEGQLDYLDMSLWDCFKQPEDPAFAGKSLIDWYAGLERKGTRLGVAGHIRDGATARACLEAGADFVLIGRAAIAHHDFPRRIAADPTFAMPELPLSPPALAGEGVNPAFMAYLRGFNGFLEPA